MMSLTKCKINASTGTYSYSIIIKNTTHIDICFFKFELSFRRNSNWNSIY